MATLELTKPEARSLRHAIRQYAGYWYDVEISHEQEEAFLLGLKHEIEYYIEDCAENFKGTLEDKFNLADALNRVLERELK